MALPLLTDFLRGMKERVIIGLVPNLPGIRVHQESRHESHCVVSLMPRLEGKPFSKKF